MLYSNDKIKLVCSDARKIIASQPPILAKYLIEDFEGSQNMDAARIFERSCKHSKLVLYHTLKERGFLSSEINLCALFFGQFTHKILLESIDTLDPSSLQGATETKHLQKVLSDKISLTSQHHVQTFDQQFKSYIDSNVL